MAFLDNSGDILLDAVLTDTGRKRMAEGTFEITKFALGDEEIDYSLYNFNDSRGSAYYDIDILSTPILEACTDNAAGLKTKLLSLSRTDLMYLPVLKIQNTIGGSEPLNDKNLFLVPSFMDEQTDTATLNALKNNGSYINGVLAPRDGTILVHQGIDNESQKSIPFPPDLYETQFLIEIDNRLGRIIAGGDFSSLPIRYLDDDQIAAYLLTSNSTQSVSEIQGTNTNTNIRGSLGYQLKFSIVASTQINDTTNYLFNLLGSTVDSSDISSGIESNTFYYIDTIVRVTGLITGFRLDIPVRFLKVQ